jgi:hypothetical protein
MQLVGACTACGVLSPNGCVRRGTCTEFSIYHDLQISITMDDASKQKAFTDSHVMTIIQKAKSLYN